jgi:hypothetical protein
MLLSVALLLLILLGVRQRDIGSSPCSGSRRGGEDLDPECSCSEALGLGLVLAVDGFAMASLCQQCQKKRTGHHENVPPNLLH